MSTACHNRTSGWSVEGRRNVGSAYEPCALGLLITSGAGDVLGEDLFDTVRGEVSGEVGVVGGSWPSSVLSVVR